MNTTAVVPIVVTLALICAVSILSFLEVGVSDVTIVMRVENKAADSETTTVLRAPRVVNLLDANEQQQFTLSSFSNPDTVFIEHNDAAELMQSSENGLSGKSICDLLLRTETIEEYRGHPTVFNISLNCFDLLGGDANAHETGTLISAFYAMRLVAAVLGRTDVVTRCLDAADDTTADLIVPWIMGIFPKLPASTLAAYPAVTDICHEEETNHNQVAIPIAALWRSIRFELRRMAISMVGIPSASHPSAKWAVENLWSDKIASRHGHGRDYLQLPHPQPGESPLYTDTSIDDAILNFQCAGITNAQKNGDYYFMKFRSYSRHLSPKVKKIGVITHLFAGSARVKGDDEDQQRCKTLLEALIDHLKEKFPKAAIRIYKDEPTALSLARAIMAQQVVVGITPHGLFPAVATFGTAYIPVSDHAKGANQWVQQSPALLKSAGTLKLVDEPMLSAFEVNSLWNKGSAILEWMLDYHVHDDYDDPIADSAGGEEEHLPELISSSDPTTVIVPYYNNTGLRTMCFDFFKGVTCQMMLGNDQNFEEHANHSTVVDISFSCYDLYKNSELGTGNYITAFYSLRMAARAMRHTDVIISCHDAEEMKDSLILPWMMGIFPRLQAGDPEYDDQPTPEDACSNFGDAALGWVANDMVFELRRMAIAMIGIPSPDHPSAAWAEENLWSKPSISHSFGRNYMQLPHPKKGDAPLFPGTEVDDAVLHFRCGDIVASNHASFGFMKFGSFSRHISPEARSIGIVTQPFEAGAQQRGSEAAEWKKQRCRSLVGAFVHHLKREFPNAKISIHNSINETIALTFGRLIMANQTVIGITSFGVFPGISTFGTGYIREPDYRKAPNKWLLRPPLLQRLNNVKLIKEPVLIAPRFKRLWEVDGGKVIEWFENYTGEI